LTSGLFFQLEKDFFKFLVKLYCTVLRKMRVTVSRNRAVKQHICHKKTPAASQGTLFGPFEAPMGFYIDGTFGLE